MSTKTFAGVRTDDANMTIQGAIYKTNILILLALASASYTWKMATTGQDAGGWILGGAIGGFIMALVTIFKKEWSAVTAPLYALLEGLFLGAISAMFEAQFKGIVLMAVGLTFCTLFAMLAGYQLGILRATDNFKRGVFAATAGVALVYGLSFLLGLFGVHMPYIHESGTFGIVFSLVVVVIAALNLVIDFDMIEQGAQSGAPKYMEWYSGFALMITLVWLYMEILRLLSKLNRR